MRVNFTVNGRQQEADDVWEGESLLYVLRERMGLPGSKNACEQGECGSCTVRLDGVPVCSCLVAAGQVEGRDVVTVEGLADFARQRAEHGGCAAAPAATTRARRHLPRGRPAVAGQAERLADRRGRRALADPAGVHRRRRRPVRFLHPRSAGRGRRAAGAQPEPVRRGHPRGAVGQPVPLHRLREDPGRGPPRGRPAVRGGLTMGTAPVTPHPHQHHPGLQDQGRHRRVHAPPGRHPQGHRRVRVLVRHVARGHAVGPHPALHGRPRRDRLHRHLRGARASPASTPS